MSWFFIALAAPLLWALVNISDQYLIAKYAKGKRGLGGLIIFTNLIGIPIAVLIGLFTANIFQISLLDKALLISIGGITVLWSVLYFFALKAEGVSTVVLWFLATPIFGYILGYIFLGEDLSFRQLIGSLIIFSGLLLISINWSGNKRKSKWKSSLYMLGSCFLISVSGIIFKYVTVGHSFWVSSFWQYVGLGLFGILMYLFIPKYRREFMAMLKSGGGNVFALTTVVELLNIEGNLLSSYAILLVPVALVYTVNSFQPVIIFLITILCTFFLPNIIKENLSMRVIFPKIIAVVVMIIGSVVLFV